MPYLSPLCSFTTHCKIQSLFLFTTDHVCEEKGKHSREENFKTVTRVNSLYSN